MNELLDILCLYDVCFGYSSIDDIHIPFPSSGNILANTASRNRANIIIQK